MWELDCEESWAPKNWCFWTVVLEKTLDSPLDCKEIQPIHSKRDQSWVFIGRTDAEAETPILWPPDVKNRLIWKDSDAGKDWRWEEKGTTEDEMVGWHHWLNGHEFEKGPGVGEGQGSLACCSPCGCKESDTTERLKWTELNWMPEKIEGRWRRARLKLRWLDGIINSIDMNLGKLWEMVRNREAWHAAVHVVSMSQTRLSDWTTATIHKFNRNIVKQRWTGWPLQSPFQPMILRFYESTIIFLLLI